MMQKYVLVYIPFMIKHVQAVYKQQDEDYNLEIYKNNKERDKCFEINY